MCGEGIYLMDEMQETIDELGGITVADSPMHNMWYVYDCRDEVLFTISYEDIGSLGGDHDMSNAVMEDWVRKNYAQEIVDILVEKEYA